MDKYTNTVPHWFKTQREREMHNNSSLVGWLCGMVGGFTKMYILQAGDVSFIIRLLEAGLTALLCGALGAAGKWAFDKYVIKKIK